MLVFHGSVDIQEAQTFSRHEPASTEDILHASPVVNVADIYIDQS